MLPLLASVAHSCVSTASLLLSCEGEDGQQWNKPLREVSASLLTAVHVEADYCACSFTMDSSASPASARCSYLGAELREPENSDWKAAGVLVFTFDRGGELLMLLGRPDYSALPQEKRRDTWNLLGAPATLQHAACPMAHSSTKSACHLVIRPQSTAP